MTQPSLAQQVLDVCLAHGHRVVTAESCTGGMVSAALTDIAGSSKAVLGGICTYSNGMKRDLLGVSADTLQAHGAVSEEVAREMAEGALARAGATLAVGITGIAGPGGSEHKPEGRVCFALAQTGRDTIAETIEFGARGRAAVREASRDHALRMLLQAPAP